MNQRLIYSSLNKTIFKNFRPIDIVKDSSYLIQKRIKYILDTFSSYGIDEETLKTKFKPSKTAQNALNFIRLSKNTLEFNFEENVKKKISDIFKLILIILGENENEFNLDQFEMQENLIEYLLRKYNTDSFSKIIF